MANYPSKDPDQVPTVEHYVEAARQDWHGVGPWVRVPLEAHTAEDDLNTTDKSKVWWKPVPLYDYGHSANAASYLGTVAARAPEEGLDPVAERDLRTVLAASYYTEQMKDAIWCAFTMVPTEPRKRVARCLGVDYGKLRVYLNRVRVKIGELGAVC